MKVRSVILAFACLIFVLSCSKENISSDQNSDKTPPSITSITPTNGEKNVDPFYYPTILFSELMDLKTITSDNIYLTDKNGVKIPSIVTNDLMYNNSTRTTSATIKPGQLLDEGAEYRINISSKCADLYGNKMASSIISTFNIADKHGPSLVEVIVINKKKIQLSFDEDIKLNILSDLKWIWLKDNKINSKWVFHTKVSLDNVFKNRLNLEIEEEFFVGDEIIIDYNISDLNDNETEGQKDFVIPINSWAFAIPRSIKGVTIEFTKNEYFIVADHRLYCLDEKGMLLWSTETFGAENVENNFSLFFDENSVNVLMTEYGFEVRKFDIPSGKLLSTKTIHRTIDIKKAELLHSDNYIIVTYNAFEGNYVEIFDSNLTSLSSLKINDELRFGSSVLISGNLYIQKIYPYPKKYGITSIPELKTPATWTEGFLGDKPLTSPDNKLLLTNDGMYRLGSDKLKFDKIWSGFIWGSSFSSSGNLYGIVNGNIAKINTQNGSEIWANKIAGTNISISKVVSDDKIVVALFGQYNTLFDCHNILIFDAITGESKD